MTQLPAPPPQRRPERPPAGEAPATGSAAAERLRDRVLQVVRPRGTHTVPTYISQDAGGFALCGRDSDVRLADLDGRARHFVLADPASYEHYVATVESPLRLPAAMPLFGVDGMYNDAIERGSALAFTTSGSVTSGDFTALKALVRELSDLTRGDVVAVVPLAVTWLRMDCIRQIVALLSKIGRPIALVLIGQYNPTDHYADVAGNLRTLYREVPNVGLWRTDVVSAMDCMAHGGLFAGIGVSGALRHCVPPNEPPQHTGRFKPSVFSPDLLDYSRADKLSRIYANIEPPPCHCQVCRGSGLDRFDSFDGLIQEQARAHNTICWLQLWHVMKAIESSDERKAWWHDKIERACAAQDQESRRVDQPKAFKPSKTLARLAKMPLETARSTAGPDNQHQGQQKRS